VSAEKTESFAQEVQPMNLERVWHLYFGFQECGRYCQLSVKVLLINRMRGLALRVMEIRRDEIEKDGI
jgi:hypothetical protein